jgi:hypothetical protein
VLIEQFTITECGVTFDTTLLAESFELTRSGMRAIRAKAPSREGPPYHPPILSDEQEFELCQMIRDQAVADNYVVKRELINDVEANRRTNLAYGGSVVFSAARR